MFRLFTPLFTQIDRLTTAFAGDVSSRIIVAVTPVVSAGLALYFTVWGILVIRGAVEQPVREFLGKVIRTGIIVSVALSAGLYQSRVAELVRTLPDDLAKVVMGNEAVVSGAPTEEGQGAVLDIAAGQGLLKVGDAFDKGTVFTQQGMAFYTFGVLLLIATVVMVGIGGAMILIAKVVLAVLAALGPLFVVALLFEVTKGFFSRWIAMVATYTLLVVLFSCVFTFLLGIFNHYMGDVKLDGNMNVAYGIGGALLLTIVSVAVLKEVHHLAVGLGGGFAHCIRPLAGVSLWGGGRRSSPPPSPPPRPGPDGSSPPPTRQG
jgi:type IV secretion system protein VirB6